MARPRMTSSALLIRASRISVASASSSASRRDRTSARSRSASRPLIARSAAPSGPASSGLIRSRPAADPDHLATQVADQPGIVRLGVAQDQDLCAERHCPADQPFDQRGLAGAGLAEDEHAGVGDQAGAQPGQRVEADDLAPQLVPPDRRARGRGAAARHEREQAAQLGGGGLVLRAGGDGHCPAAVGDLPAPRGWQWDGTVGCRVGPGAWRGWVAGG